MPLGTEVDLSPGHIVRQDPGLPPQKGHSIPSSFWPMSIVATVAHLSYCWAPVAQLMAESPYSLQWVPFPHRNCPFPLGSGPPSNSWFLGLIQANNPNGTSFGSAVLQGSLVWQTDRQTNQPTDHATRSVTSTYVVLRCGLITSAAATTTVLRQLYRTTCVSLQHQLRTGGYYWSKVLLSACPCRWQLVHLDEGEDTKVLLNGVTCTISVPSKRWSFVKYKWFYEYKFSECLLV